jgi:hypothetical protein
MSQPRLFDAPLTCFHGEPWDGDHPLCRADVERACQRFDDAVARGEYDAHGWTPKERKAQAKRKDLA